jgi:hypothetical protein
MRLGNYRWFSTAIRFTDAVKVKEKNKCGVNLQLYFEGRKMAVAAGVGLERLS